MVFNYPLISAIDVHESIGVYMCLRIYKRIVKHMRGVDLQLSKRR
jgi:hypothetical protein